MVKQEEINNSEENTEENLKIEEMSEELKKMAENVEANPPAPEAQKQVSRRGFLGKIAGVAAGALFGGKIMESIAEGAEKNETAEEKEKREANKLLSKLFALKTGANLEDDSRTKARKKLAMDRVAEVSIKNFAAKKKKGYPQGDINVTVFREDEDAALEVLETNLNSAIETRFRNAKKEDETITIEAIKKQIYSHPGIAKLHSMIEMRKEKN